MSEVLTGTCACGSEVTREIPQGRFASLLRRIPLVCSECVGPHDDEVDYEREVAERAQEALGRRRAASGVPEHLRAWNFDGVAPELAGAVALARRWAEGEVNGVLLSGPVGVGKTRVAIAAANEMLVRRQVKFFSAPLLLARLGSGDFASPLRQEATEVLTGTVAVVIDDIDKARPTTYAAEQVFLAVDLRADGAAPILVTTNKRLREIADWWPEPYGEAIASRLSMLEAVRVEGDDRRVRRRS